MYVIQHCFICRPSDSTVSKDAGIEPRTVATLALTARCSNHLARSHTQRMIKTFVLVLIAYYLLIYDPLVRRTALEMSELEKSCYFFSSFSIIFLFMPLS
jgi:hypothetical protein